MNVKEIPKRGTSLIIRKTLPFLKDDANKA